MLNNSLNNLKFEKGNITFTVTGFGMAGNLYYSSIAVSKSFEQNFTEKPFISTASVYNPSGNAIVNASLGRDKNGIMNIYILCTTNVTGNFGIDYIAIGK